MGFTQPEAKDITEAMLTPQSQEQEPLSQSQQEPQEETVPINSNALESPERFASPQESPWKEDDGDGQEQFCERDLSVETSVMDDLRGAEPKGARSQSDTFPPIISPDKLTRNAQQESEHWARVLQG